MDVIREAENYLRHYASLKKSAEHAEYMVGKIHNRSKPSDKVTASYDPIGVHADNPINTLNDLYELQRWTQIQHDNLQEIRHIDELLDSISQDNQCLFYKDLLLMWYVNKIDRFEISQRLGFSKSHLYRARDRAIKMFALELFGISAIKVI